MAHVAVIDDVDTIRVPLENAIRAEGHQVSTIDGDTMAEMVESTVAIADQHPDYILILDFNLRQGPRDGEIWGGIWFYIALRDRGALPCAGRIVVASRYISTDLRSLKSASKPADAFIARVFVELEGIADENIFKLDVGNAYQQIAGRISQIDAEPLKQNCPRCGQLEK